MNNFDVVTVKNKQNFNNNCITVLLNVKPYYLFKPR